jgi:hypothetical protein
MTSTELTSTELKGHVTLASDTNANTNIGIGRGNTTIWPLLTDSSITSTGSTQLASLTGPTAGEYFATISSGNYFLILKIPYALKANKSVNITISCRSNRPDMDFYVTHGTGTGSGLYYRSKTLLSTTTTYTFTVTNSTTDSSDLNLYAYCQTTVANSQFIYSQFALYPITSNALDVNGPMNVTGNVGIGTTTPAYKLDVNGTSRLGSWVMGSVSSVDLKALGTNLPLDLENYALYQDNVNTYLNTKDGGSISFNIKNSRKWGIRASGNLYQNDATGDLLGINLPNNGAGINWGNGTSRIVDDGHLRICSDDYIFFQTGSSSTSFGTAKMTILAGGNVGIGTTSPSSTLDVAGRINTNEISYGYSTNPTLSSTSLGYSVKSDFGSGGVAQGGKYTLASFTNQPIGIYLLTVGPTTVYGFIGGERCDISFESTTGFASFTTFNTMENGGNSAEKLGICFSMPVKVTLATNELTVKLNAVTGDYSITGGSSSLTRIA